jgi:tetratricopeptide (TPR) repeat protein
VASIAWNTRVQLHPVRARRDRVALVCGALTAVLATLLAAPASLGVPTPYTPTVESCVVCDVPCDIDACHRLAIELAASGDFDRAIPIEERVHTLQPDNPQVAAALARMHHVGRKDTVRAIALFHAALGASSGYPPALFGLGIIMREKGEMEIAARYFARGAKEQPEMPLFKVQLARTLVEAGRVEEAQPLLVEVVQKWPDTDDARAARKLMSRIALATP